MVGIWFGEFDRPGLDSLPPLPHISPFFPPILSSFHTLSTSSPLPASLESVPRVQKGEEEKGQLESF